MKGRFNYCWPHPSWTCIKACWMYHNVLTFRPLGSSERLHLLPTNTFALRSFTISCARPNGAMISTSTSRPPDFQSCGRRRDVPELARTHEAIESLLAKPGALGSLVVTASSKTVSGITICRPDCSSRSPPTSSGCRFRLESSAAASNRVRVAPTGWRTPRSKFDRWSQER